jgi:hypothetical protein
VYKDVFFRASGLNPLNSMTFDPYHDSGVLIKKDERERERERERDRVGKESKLKTHPCGLFLACSLYPFFGKEGKINAFKFRKCSIQLSRHLLY